MGLLLLRTTIGITSIVQGSVGLSDFNNQSPGSRVVGLLAIVIGTSLLAGFLTPITSALVGVGNAGIALSWFPAPMPNLLDSNLSTIFVIIMAAVTVFLGPGAFSIDALLFGRREIIIPRSTRSPKS